MQMEASRSSETAVDAVEFRAIESLGDATDAAAVLDRIWGGDRGGMPVNLLRALAGAGNYVFGIWSGESMIGASVAFFGEPGSRSMHSHITGVLPGWQGRGVGRALKQHQRAWALERSVGTITWTFDPLVARNAYFNLDVLGVRVRSYLVNHYGAMDDGVNSGDETDRLLVAWSLAAAHPGEPDAEAIRAIVAIPQDIETLRRSNPPEALRWRRQVRSELIKHREAGLTIAGFRPGQGYLLVAT